MGNLLRTFRKVKALQKGAEPTISIPVIALLLTIILKRQGVDILEDDATNLIIGVSASASGLYGAFCTIRNWIKNRKK